jgi:hypothetical protein
MLQTAVINGVSFDPFPFSDDGIIAPKVDICGRDIIEVHVVMLVVVVTDEYCFKQSRA